MKLRILCSLLALVFLQCLPCPAAEKSRPNVIIVLTDDQGYGDLSAHGNPVLKTPNLDKLHEESIRFTDFHVTPMCTPTRGQLISGRHCLVNGAMNVSSGRTLLRKELPTMADVFAANGYRCGQFGKWHLGDNYPYRPQDRGFHESLWYPSSHIGSAPDFWNNHYFDDTYWHNGKRQKFTGYTTDVFFDEAIRWMRDQAGKDKPFFCYLATAAAHSPHYVPKKYRDLYPDQQGRVARFFGMIANIDENMGKLEAFLREGGLRDNTILIFMTDNGGTVGVPVFNAGMRGEKIQLWDGGHRVPCFIRWPGGKLQKPRDIPGLAEVQDILPTVADLCGLKKHAKATFEGVSLSQVLRGEEENLPHRMLVVQFSRMENPVPKKGDAAVLWKRWRLVSDKELYDLETDPGQTNNVIARHPEVAAKMRAHYNQWWAEVEPRMNEHGAITVGHNAENPLQLSPADWEDSFMDQGRQVRRGFPRNGAWNIDVARSGEYEIELRRWPREADTPIPAELPAFQHIEGQYEKGVALPVTKARLKVASFDDSKPVTGSDKAIIFSTRLKTGRTQLQTWFYNTEGKELCGAYYVYVTKK